MAVEFTLTVPQREAARYQAEGWALPGDEPAVRGALPLLAPRGAVLAPGEGAQVSWDLRAARAPPVTLAQWLLVTSALACLALATGGLTVARLAVGCSVAALLWCALSHRPLTGFFCAGSGGGVRWCAPGGVRVTVVNRGAGDQQLGAGAPLVSLLGTGDGVIGRLQFPQQFDPDDLWDGPAGPAGD